MDDQLLQALQVRYIKLHFTISFIEDSILPVHKVSALRGGMGEMLLRANCIRDRACGSCDFESECIVRRTMYSKFEEKPGYVTNGESIGYVLECENYKTYFSQGETLAFNLILFGKTIVYFNQYLQALYTLGMCGIGVNHAKFIIESIKNTCFQDILDGNDIFMKNYQVQTISHYVTHRMKKMTGTEKTLVFQTPATLKYQGKFLQEFCMDAILSAVKRRIHMLDYFEGIHNDFYHDYQVPVPEEISQQQHHVKVRRYSSRQGAMFLHGITGLVQLKELFPNTLPLLLAGELIHIGKNTSFGFGRYQIM
ncbi:MAG: CRISPR system precrRNA processing endoribonuclease RAMP protein Cas6 [Lachnospiraceae bacterium]|nr:CRISPR system precrRNA processing endoribonuclease RAMP protein Cas6 [Lachnospiraceae bacterium]